MTRTREASGAQRSQHRRRGRRRRRRRCEQRLPPGPVRTARGRGRRLQRAGRGQHGALVRVSQGAVGRSAEHRIVLAQHPGVPLLPRGARHRRRLDRKSTRLNSSHVEISYAVFCLKKKKQKKRLLYFVKQKKKKNNNI